MVNPDELVPKISVVKYKDNPVIVMKKYPYHCLVKDKQSIVSSVRYEQLDPIDLYTLLFKGIKDSITYNNDFFFTFTGTEFIIRNTKEEDNNNDFSISSNTPIHIIQNQYFKQQKQHLNIIL